ncbi:MULTISPECIES: hypothetical protein [Streptomyces]|uniref:Uncharacterized protein n=1 Tax=Streptomyces eurythermus TaxID=42237 RepID=A0ABW6Z7N7_9ACTN|nr:MULTISPECIES: hypothetical protein [Streptomyces]
MSCHVAQIATCLAELEHEYITAVDNGEPQFLPWSPSGPAPS